jgi:EDD domain protein, DegV family
LAIKIVTDSTSYIPEHLINEYGILKVSLSVSFESETYKEEDIDNSCFYDKMSKSNKLPTSSQPTLQDICGAFEKIVSQGNSAVGIFLSSKMSGTYSSAITAKNMVLEKYPDAVIEIVDSKSNSMQLGFSVLSAAEAAHEGKTVREVLDAAYYVIERSRFLFAPEVLDYLRKGGRIGNAAALIGNILQIKPILTVVDGETAVFAKVRTRAKAIEKIVGTFLEEIEKKGLGDVIVHHINDEVKGRELADMIEEKIGRAVPVCSIGPVIGIHVGPGTVGIVYYTK